MSAGEGARGALAPRGAHEAAATRAAAGDRVTMRGAYDVSRFTSDTRGRTLLAIDTALGTSVALGCDGVIVQAASDDPRGHAEAIGPLLRLVFDEAGANPRDVDGVVMGVGPGLFTGLRVGMAAAQAFARAAGSRERGAFEGSAGAASGAAHGAKRGAAGPRERGAFEGSAGAASGAAHGAKRGVSGVPVLPLQGHDAVALEVLARPGGVGRSESLRVVQDARRRELFVTEYAPALDAACAPVRTAEARLVSREGFDERPGDVWPERIPAAALVEVALRRLAAGRGFESGRALYLRSPDVQAPGAPKRVST